MPIFYHLHYYVGEYGNQLGGKILIWTYPQQLHYYLLFVWHIGHEVDDDAAANAIPHGVNDGNAGKNDLNGFGVPFEDFI